MWNGKSAGLIQAGAGGWSTFFFRAEFRPIPFQIIIHVASGFRQSKHDCKVFFQKIITLWFCTKNHMKGFEEK